MFVIPEIPSDIFQRRFKELPPGTFSTTSLLSWLSFVKKAQIPFVDAIEVGNYKIDDLLRFDEVHNKEAQLVAQELEKVNEGRKEGHMLRWDVCAGLSFKEKMAYGLGLENSDYDLVAEEPRTFDILYETPAENVAVVERPWVNAKMYKNFPVEFRVFVNEGEVKAVANYYVQRPLEDTPEVRAWMKQAVRYTQSVIEEVKRQGLCPAFYRQSNPGEQFAATLDFLVSEAGEVMFLEAGPGFGFGAHPCSFVRGNGVECDEVEGAKLGSEVPTIALNDL